MNEFGHITLVGDKAIAALVRRCYSDVQVRDREGERGRGFTNLKRIFGWPTELRIVVDALAATTGTTQAIASTDSGSAPLAALVAYKLSLPAVFVRREAKDYFLSYGGDPATNHPRLSGERLSEGTRAHVIEDFVHTGATLAAAVKALRSVGLAVPTASSVLISPPETIADAIVELDIHLTALVATNELGD